MSSPPNVWVRDGLVFMTVEDSDGYDTTNCCEPSYAREMATALIDAAEEAEGPPCPGSHQEAPPHRKRALCRVCKQLIPVNPFGNFYRHLPAGLR